MAESQFNADMEALTLVDLILTAGVAFVIGMLIGAIGIGGVLLTPWLTQVIGVPVLDAIVISSLAFVATGVAAVVVAVRTASGTDSIDWRLVGATVPGALTGAWALSVIPAGAALILLAILTSVIGFRVLLPRRRASGPPPELPRTGLTPTELTNSGLIKPGFIKPGFIRPGRHAASLVIGFLAGFGSALTGTGGPMVLTPMLLWRGLPMLAAISLGQLVQLPIGLTATAGNLYFGDVDIGAGITIGLILVPGVFLGVRTARALPLIVLSRVVGVTLIAAGISFAVKAVAAS